MVELQVEPCIELLVEAWFHELLLEPLTELLVEAWFHELLLEPFTDLLVELPIWLSRDTQYAATGRVLAVSTR